MNGSYQRSFLMLDCNAFPKWEISQSPNIHCMQQGEMGSPCLYSNLRSITPLFINQILYNVKMSLACSVMKWCLLVCIQTWWVTPLFINQIHYDVQMTLLSSITKRSTAIHTRLKCLDHVRSVMKNLTVFRWPFSAAMYKGVLCCQRGHKVLQWIVFLKLEPQLKIWNNHFHN